ncbi:MAG TPA: protein kinase [Galbitalea sp.]
MQTQDATPATLGGYRLVRTLGEGSRSEVMLGAGTTGNLALKVFRPEVTDDAVGCELEALGRVPREHCARLVDVVSTETRHPVFAFERVQRGSVANWLRDRGDISPGEAVTLLAPLASTITRLHRGGVAHTNLRATNIHIGQAGEPVILGFGHSTVFDVGSSVATIDAMPEVRRDRVALATLARLVLSSVRPIDGSPGVEPLDAWLEATSASPTFEFAAQLEAKLFDFARPTSLEFSVRAPSAPRGGVQTPGAVLQRDSGVGTAAAIGRLGSGAGRPAATSYDWLGQLLDSSPAKLARAMALPAIRSVRRPVWIAAGSVTVALIFALVLVPQSGRAQPARADSPIRHGNAQSAASPSPQPSVGAKASHSANPITALPALFAARERCFVTRSVRCLVDVDEAASGALVIDTAAIQHMQKGSETPRESVVAAPAPKLVERLGDAALVQLDRRGSGSTAKPASVLLVRSKAGWRIRSYLSGEQAETR